MRSYCKACMLEKDLREMWGLKSKKGEGGERNQKKLAFCVTFNVHAHTSIASCERMIFQIPEFKGLSCFQIFHHKKCNDLHQLAGGVKTQTKINKKHEIFDTLRSMHENKYGPPKATFDQLKKQRSEKKRKASSCTSELNGDEHEQIFENIVCS